jgi:dienelactone hydrolase
MVKFASALVLAWLLATPALGGSDAADSAGPSQIRPGILDLGALPQVPRAGQADYGRFLLQATPRVFALSQDGSWGWAAAQESMAAAETRALEICGRGSRDGSCAIYARDLDVVWPGRESAMPRIAEAPIVGGQGWSLFPDARFLWHGAARARGAYVWAHGRAAGGQDSRWTQPQPHVRAFNNAGYDVIRFDRAPETDETEPAALWLRQAVRDLRARGYRRIVVGGQSRGAWNALQALTEPGLVDAVVAIAPAAHGATGSPAWAWALADLRQVVTAARDPAARVVVATFARDEFDPDPAQRSVLFRSLADRVGALLLLDRPPEVTGHGGGADSRFAIRYAPCLLEFAEGRVASCR